METIGTGSMGVVWQARDERLGRVVAVKQLLIQPGRSPEQAEEARRRAMREARIAARLQHNNAISVYDVVEHHGEPCMVMEYLPSRSLATMLTERGALPPREVAEIGSQVATALAAAHAAGIVHRDIKPANILIDYSGTVKLTDFGISRATDDGTLTQTAGMVAGTPAYLAPEVAQGKDHTQSSDVFSLGSTLFHAVEGEPPYGFKDNPLAQLYAVAMGGEPELRFAGALRPVLSRLLSRDPQVRPSVQQVRHELNTIASVGDGARLAEVVQSGQAAAPGPAPTAVQPAVGGGTMVGAQAQGPPPTPPPAKATQRTSGRSRRKVWLALLAAVLLLAAGTATLILVNSSGDPASPTPPAASEPAEPEPSESSAPPSEPETPPEGEPVNDWGAAGRLVIAYYGGDAAAAWGMLTPNAQQAFGGRQAFNEYWAQYDAVWSCCADGVSNNPDGSANVPVRVTYQSDSGTDEQARQVRVTRLNGELRIDSAAK
ncbi:serine/threonine protein kinase [Tamaricihabitans halophyticus]|uniref:non-specific serine/threonine protein kinase n=1 Tax=Tamaricihabitans halophyticus TaxID=1262583 RepID=A0A4V6NR48_9PSEU|nr:serine/threonine-protein kinase [Tamaricihabitans halophyticus]TCP45366.1 serine/threonine protein kinase [Tamaricihabitans halophyticus]